MTNPLFQDNTRFLFSKIVSTHDEVIDADWDECDFADDVLEATAAEEAEGTWEVAAAAVGMTTGVLAVVGSGDLVGASLAAESTSWWLEEVGLLLTSAGVVREATPPVVWSSGQSSGASSRPESLRFEIFTFAVPLTTSRNLRVGMKKKYV